ncbi:hypothetical protein GCM10009551_080030 [Nocardiopsis tropica]
MPSPFNGGPVGHPGHPGGQDGTPYPGGPQGYPPLPPTGGYPAEQLRGEVPQGYGGYQDQGDRFGRPSGPGGPGSGYSEMLGGSYPAQQPQQSQPDYGGYPPLDGWQQHGDEGRPDGPGAPGPYPPEQPYDQRGYGQERYEGGYEDGRFR